MAFRDREKRRLVDLKPRLFSASACKSGVYRNRERDFCLRNDRAKENLHASIREEALHYFSERGIGWHYGIGNGPSNHLCCSQSCCVNFWFPFIDAPEQLAQVLRGLGYAVAEMLPFELDGRGNSCPYVAFEWIGEQNYLRERVRGKVARNDQRTRGANFTSLDFAFRFRRSDGRIQIVAGEWKYTESYGVGRNKRVSRNGTDRLAIYRPALEDRRCQIKLGRLAPEDLFFDPFDQLMRQQLLCSFMEGEREMKADIVSLLHVAPKANRQLMARVTSPALQSYGSDIHEVWDKLVKSGRFCGKSVEEDLLPLVHQYAPDAQWADYMQLRYGCMQ